MLDYLVVISPRFINLHGNLNGQLNSILTPYGYSSKSLYTKLRKFNTKYGIVAIP